MSTVLDNDQKLMVILAVVVALFLLILAGGKLIGDVLSPPTPQEDCMNQAQQLDSEESEKEAYYKCLESLGLEDPKKAL